MISTGSSSRSEEPPACPTDVAEPARLALVNNVVPHRSSRREKWADWRWQMRNRIRTPDQLVTHFPHLADTTSLRQAVAMFPMAITPYYASLIKFPDVSDPVFQMCIPQIAELNATSVLREDPLEEDKDMPVPGLVHRYPDRALCVVTTTCASYCRHCTRKRMAGMKESIIPSANLREMVVYLKAHPEIKDVIISGGDPMTMATSVLERMLKAIRSVRSVEVIRIGTRTPVVLPQRITEELTAMLRKYHPIWVNTHFNHPNELSAEAATACARLVDAGIPLGNQSVLLRGVNDNAQVIESLCRGLVQMRVRPYYLFQCDLVRGVEHFRTPLSRGMEIMEYLRGRLSGLAIPSFVVDAPHGGGKIPLLPNYVVSMSPTHTVLRNSEGMLVAYPEPAHSVACANAQNPNANASGVWSLVSGADTVLTPASCPRIRRRRSKTHAAARHSEKHS